jgi:pimeloyl-ACP methyl ester carboxylesterase
MVSRGRADDLPHIASSSWRVALDEAGVGTLMKEAPQMTEPLPILLIPGLLASARLYAEQLPQLWRFGPVTITDHTRDESIDAIAGRIVASAPPRFALVGLSMGGYIAFEIMRQAPDQVTKLALLDTSARADTPEQSERRRAQIRLAQSGRFAEISDLLFPLLVHRGHRGDQALRRLVRLMADETGPDAFVRQQKAIMARPDSRPGLAAIACPTLVLVGEDDQLIPPEHSAQIASGLPAATLTVVPDCGHLSTLERPRQVTQALVEWLQT